MMSLMDGAIARMIEAHTGKPAPLVSRRETTGGGSINHTEILHFVDGTSYFLKTNGEAPPGFFACEARGLAALAASGKIRTPRALGHGGGDIAVPPFLLMEYIPPGVKTAGFQKRLGRQLAELHRATMRTDGRFGFDHDNHIGTTPQPNGWMNDWVAFWRERRLGFQLELAGRMGMLDDELRQLGARLSERLDELIGQPDEPACLLHGDLWGGNSIVDKDGNAVLIDPAAYYGRREADLAMTLLFGGFTKDFHAAYEAEYPLAPGSEHRLAVYKLYHVLNHYLMFGGGYRSQAVELMRNLTG